jgi:hypothetical protein
VAMASVIDPIHSGSCTRALLVVLIRPPEESKADERPGLDILDGSAILRLQITRQPNLSKISPSYLANC